MSREVLIIGDSNVRRFYNKLGRQVKQLEFIQDRNLEEASAAFELVKPDYKFVVFAFVTNLIINAGEEAQNAVDRVNSISEMFDNLLGIMRRVSSILDPIMILYFLMLSVS